MRKTIVALSTVLLVSSCGYPRESRVAPAGRGVVTEVEHEATEYYSKRDCEKKFGKGACRVPRVKSLEHWEVDYLDDNTREEVEVKVSKQVADGCVGRFEGDQKYFNGASCQPA